MWPYKVIEAVAFIEFRHQILRLLKRYNGIGVAVKEAYGGKLLVDSVEWGQFACAGFDLFVGMTGEASAK